MPLSTHLHALPCGVLSQLFLAKLTGFFHTYFSDTQHRLCKLCRHAHSKERMATVCVLLANTVSKKPCCCIVWLGTPWAHEHLMSKVVQASVCICLALHRAGQLLRECMSYVLVLWLISHGAVISRSLVTRCSTRWECGSLCLL